jgi:hypothetical protein
MHKPGQVKDISLGIARVLELLGFNHKTYSSHFILKTLQLGKLKSVNNIFIRDRGWDFKLLQNNGAEV